MVSVNIFRRVLAFALVAFITVSSIVPALAQRRRARRTPQATQTSPPRRQFRGSAHPRPPRTYDVLNYTIRTRFDVPNKTVLGDETVTLKPLGAGFRSFELDASSMEIETVALADTGTEMEKAA
jgi:hypothetical protein